MSKVISKGLAALSVLLLAFVAMAIVTPQAHAYYREFDGLDTEDPSIFGSNPTYLDNDTAELTVIASPQVFTYGDDTPLMFEVYNTGTVPLYGVEICINGFGINSTYMLEPGGYPMTIGFEIQPENGMLQYYDYTVSALYTSDNETPLGIVEPGGGVGVYIDRDYTVNFHDKSGSVLSYETFSTMDGYTVVTSPAYTGTVGSGEAFDYWTMEPSSPSTPSSFSFNNNCYANDNIGSDNLVFYDMYDDNNDGVIDFYPVFRRVTPTISVNKEIDVPSSVNLAGLTYAFDFQAAAPVQGELSAYAVPAGVDIPTVTLTAANSTLATGSDSVRNLTGSVNLPDPNLFGHAGVYAFTVTETVTGANANDHWDNDQSVYKVRLYVMNDGNGGLMYSDGSDANQTPAMMFELIEDIDGNAAASNTKPSALAFKNIYDKTVPFEVAKSVAGEYANRSKKFGFAVALDFPDYVADNTTYAYTTSAGGSGTVTVTSGAATLSNIQLADGETLNFASLPVGTVYTVTELDARDGVNNYVPSATYTYSGVGAANSGYETHQNSVAAGTAGQQNYAVNSTSGAAQNLNTILGAGAGNRVDVLNTLSNPPSPTGIIVASIPDLLLVGIPASLIAVWMVYRGRREEDYGF